MTSGLSATLNRIFGQVRRPDLLGVAAPLLISLGFLLLIALSGWLVAEHRRPTLNWDQWSDLRYIFAYQDHVLSFRHLFAQNNEHRIFTARLFYMIDAFWFGYRNIFLILVIFTSHTILGAIIGWLWFDRSYDFRLRVASALGGAATMVAIVQFENLIWGFQTTMAQVYLFGLFGLLALGRACMESRPSWRWFYLAVFVFCYALSTFTLANGILLAGAALVLSLLMRPRRDFLIVIVAAAALFAWLYYRNYQTAPHAQIRISLSLIPDYLLYVCHMLAGPLTRSALARDLIGGVGLAALLGATVLLIRDAVRGRTLPLRPVVLTCLAGFVFASTVVTAIGRLTTFGIAQASSGRYATTALIFWLSILGAVHWIACERLALLRSAGMRRAAGLALLLLLLLQVYRFDSNADTRREMSEWALRIDRAAVTILNNVYLNDRAGLDILYIPQIIRENSRRLREEGWSLFSPTDRTYTPPIQLVAGLPDNVPTCRGFVDRVDRLDRQRLAFRGWLLASSAPESPDWIFVRDQLGGVVGFFLALDWRSDLAAQFGHSAGRGYFGAVDFKRPIDSETLKISFVAVFSEGKERACKFDSEIALPVHETISSYGDLPARSLGPLQTESQGRLKPVQTWPPFPAFPFTDALPLIATDAPSGPASAVFRFDLAALGSDDLAIPIGSRGDFVVPVEITGSAGPIASVKTNAYRDDVWQVWRVIIFPRARLPATGEITISVHVPPEAPPAGFVVGPPFATPQNQNRAALY